MIRSARTAVVRSFMIVFVSQGATHNLIAGLDDEFLRFFTGPKEVGS